MIGSLRGRVIDRDGLKATIDVGGVGYELEMTGAAAAVLDANRDEVLIHTHLVVREDAHSLYGFANAPERDLFRSLIGVTGIGPKIALGLLSSVTPDVLANAITSGNVAALVRVPGIGRKTAQRLVVELRDKLHELSATVNVGTSPTEREAILALRTLGYRERTASDVVGEVVNGSAADWSVEELVRAALARLATG